MKRYLMSRFWVWWWKVWAGRNYSRRKAILYWLRHKSLK